MEIEHIYTENIKEFLAWAGFGKLMADLTQEEDNICDSMVDNLVNYYGLSVKYGYNPEIKPIRMTLEPLHFCHRPFLTYVLTWAVQAFGELVLISMGFSKCEDAGVKYWFKRGDRTTEEGSSAPLVFFHGISPGQCVYLYVTSRLGCDREAVVLMDTPGVGMSLGSFDPISREQVVEAVESLCKRHSLKKVCVAGHSYGSITAGYVARDLPERVCQVVLLDPVSLQLGLPDVAYNFLYRKPKNFTESLKQYMTSTELTVANSLRYVACAST